MLCFLETGSAPIYSVYTLPLVMVMFHELYMRYELVHNKQWVVVNSARNFNKVGLRDSLSGYWNNSNIHVANSAKVNRISATAARFNGDQSYVGSIIL